MKNYSSLTDFLNHWSDAERKTVIRKELEEQGVLVSDLEESVNKEVDLFDLICHVAYDQPPLSRKERASNVKKRDYFTKYGKQSRAVLEALLDKYADEGVTTIEKTEVLALDPFTELGSPPEIIKMFGGIQNYTQAVTELKNQLYKAL